MGLQKDTEEQRLEDTGTGDKEERGISKEPVSLTLKIGIVDSKRPLLNYLLH